MISLKKIFFNQWFVWKKKVSNQWLVLIVVFGRALPVLSLRSHAETFFLVQLIRIWLQLTIFTIAFGSNYTTICSQINLNLDFFFALFFFCNFTGFLAIFKVVTSATTTFSLFWKDSEMDSSAWVSGLYIGF